MSGHAEPYKRTALPILPASIRFTAEGLGMKRLFEDSGGGLCGACLNLRASKPTPEKRAKQTGFDMYSWSPGKQKRTTNKLAESLLDSSLGSPVGTPLDIKVTCGWPRLAYWGWRLALSLLSRRLPGHAPIRPS